MEEKYKFWEFEWINYVLEDMWCTNCWKYKVQCWALSENWNAPNCYWEQCCWMAMILKTNRFRKAFKKTNNDKSKIH